MRHPEGSGCVIQVLWNQLNNRMSQCFIIRSHSPFFSNLLLTSIFNPSPSLYRLQSLEGGGGESLLGPFWLQEWVLPLCSRSLQQFTEKNSPVRDKTHLCLIHVQPFTGWPVWPGTKLSPSKFQFVSSFENRGVNLITNMKASFMVPTISIQWIASYRSHSSIRILIIETYTSSLSS